METTKKGKENVRKHFLVTTTGVSKIFEIYIDIQIQLLLCNETLLKTTLKQQYMRKRIP